MSCREHVFLLFLGAGLLFAIQSASAEILVEEAFSHPNGNLVGQSPLPGPGRAWAALADEGNTAIQVNDGWAFLSQGSGSGGREDAIIGFTRQPGTATTYARFDFALPSNQNSDIANLDAMGSNFVHFKSNLLTTHFRARTGVLAADGGGDFRIAINANGSRLDEGTAWANGLSFDTIYRVVVSWNAANGESRLWLNPVDELSTSISNTGHSTGQRLESFALRQSSDYNGTQFIDNLVVATTFFEALLGSGGVETSGDYNGNRIVDAADYVVWRDNLSAPAGTLPNDTSGGVIGQAQYDAWKANFGAASLWTGAASGAAQSGAVPEPDTLVLLMFAAAGWCLRRGQTT